MYTGRFVFSQIIDYLPRHQFHRCVQRYGGDYKVQKFSCFEQFLCMGFAELTYRESLRNIETCLRAVQPKLYHAGIRSGVSKSTLADANEKRDWRIYADFAQVLIAMARPLYSNEDLGIDLDNTLYALDSTTIDLCLSLFPWARFRKHKGAVKVHTLLDLRGSIPYFIEITDGKVHDVNILDLIIPEAGAYYVMDRAYLHYERLYRIAQCGSFFVTRARRGFQFRRLYSQKVDKSTGLRSDQTVALVSFYPAKAYPERLRRITYLDPDSSERFVFLTNQFALPAIIITQIYRLRWQIELFFKWIKQHLRIKSFFGTSENAVKTQIWIAVSVYVLIAIIRKRLRLEISLHKILQILSFTLFEKTPMTELLTETDYTFNEHRIPKQLELFDL